MIDAELEKQAKQLCDDLHKDGRIYDSSLLNDLLDAIDAHECKPVASGVSDELSERAEIILGLTFSADAYVEAKRVIRELLAIADAKPEEKQPCWVVKLSDEVSDVLSEEVVAAYKAIADAQGWQDGPPTEPGLYGIVGLNGIPHTSSIREGRDVASHHKVVRHYRIPPPPQRELVVKHKEGCEWADGIIRNGEEWIIGGQGHLGELKFCPGCGAELLEREK